MVIILAILVLLEISNRNEFQRCRRVVNSEKSLLEHKIMSQVSIKMPKPTDIEAKALEEYEPSMLAIESRIYFKGTLF